MNMMMTQTESENVALIKRGFEAFNAHDMATLADTFDSNVRWLSPKAGILDGEYNGRDALFAFFAQLGRETDGTFSSKPASFAATGDEVFVHATVTGKRKGNTLEQDEVLIFTLKDGRVREVRLFIREQAAAELFWS